MKVAIAVLGYLYDRM